MLLKKEIGQKKLEKDGTRVNRSWYDHHKLDDAESENT